MIVPLLLQSDPGMVAWRRPDGSGQRCVSCHSPDGIELSAFGFKREDVLRRALRHLSSEDASNVLAMLSRRAAVATPEDRPLQPGGAVLPGETAGARDLAFLRSLPAVVPTLAEGRVASEGDALRVRDELRRLDLTALRVGIPFNRLSEDGFHGAAHRSIANWIPDVPVPGVSEAAVERYLAEPSDQNLRSLDAGVRAKAQSAGSAGEILAIAKYRSLLVLQHRLRTGRLVALTVPGRQGLNQNPFWDVADFARVYGQRGEVAVLGFPATVAAEKVGGPSYAAQLKELRLPWFWLGWTLDPALQMSGLTGETQRGDYFVQALWSDGPYPAHLALMISKKLVEQGFNPRLWNESRYGQRYEFAFSGFVLGDELGQLKLAGEYGARFRRLAANSLRTGMFLARKSVRETGEAIHPEAQMNQVRRTAAYLKTNDPQAGDSGLVADLIGRLGKAKALR